MYPLADLAQTHTALDADGLDHLHRFTVQWSLLADLSFADLILVAPVSADTEGRFVVLAQVRPTTGQTLYPNDLVGTFVAASERPEIGQAWAEAYIADFGAVGMIGEDENSRGHVVEGEARVLGGSDPVLTQCFPVCRGGKALAVLVRDAAFSTGRRPGELERVYVDTFGRLARMVSQGEFPFSADDEDLEEAPRVGDGVIVLDADRHVRFASPNAVSVMHRMGIHAYAKALFLSDVGFDDAAAIAAMRSRHPVIEEVQHGDVTVLVRVIPFLDHTETVGAAVLLRDVSDLRRRDQMLLSKDATIREIHHRVKNNLQTIASLLRLQGRRLESEEARRAVEESERRIRAIAIVHETLSREVGDAVELGEIVRPLLKVIEEDLVDPERRIQFEVEGSTGQVPGEIATPLAVVLNELVQNAVEHAFPQNPDSSGPADANRQVNISLARLGDEITVEVHDNGVGLPEGLTSGERSGLGLSIVNALVAGELGGSIEITRSNGTLARLVVPLSN